MALKATKETVTTPASPNQLNFGYDTTTLKPIAVDESGNVVVLGGFAVKDYRLIKVTTITQGTTTYTPSAGTKAIYAEAWGAGGGASGCQAATNTSLGAAAGAGAKSAVWLTDAVVSNFTSAWSCVVGLGGTGGAANANGVSGTATTLTDPGATMRLKADFGVLGATANGLAAGTAIGVTAAGGLGGLVANGIGDTLFPGGDGCAGLRAAAASFITGAGGACPSGGAGGVGKIAVGTGSAGGFPGGGGGAPVDTANTSRTGGAGANGLLRIWEFA